MATMCRAGLHDLDEPGVAAEYDVVGGGGVKRKSRRCKPCAVARSVRNSQTSRIRLKDRVIELYGGRCACCGIERRVFLALDHVGGGGGTERAGRSNLGSYRNALREYRPDVYRVLCHNCNMAMHHEENHTCEGD